MNLGSNVKLQEYLSQIPIELAQTIALENNLQCNLYSKARLIEALTQKFRDRRFLKRLFDELSEIQTSGIMMTLFFKEEEEISIEQYHEELQRIFPEDECDAAEIMSTLIERGILYVASPEEEEGDSTYSIPVDLAEALLEIIGQDLLERLEFLPDPPQRVRFDDLAIIRDIFTFLAFLKRDNVKLTQEFVIFKRTQLRILDSFELPERPLEDTDKEREFGYYPPRFDFIYKFCEAKGLTVIEGNYLRITDDVEEWLEKPDFFKMKEIFQFWQDHYMTSAAEAQLLLRLLLLIPRGKWLTASSVNRVFDILLPEYRWFKQSSKQRDPNFLNVLLYIGGIEQSQHRDANQEEFGIRISPLGTAILVNDISLFPKKVEKNFAIRPNFEVVASKNLEPSIRWELGKIAEMLRINDEVIYKLSRQSIYHTLQEGKSVEDIMTFLETHAEHPIPPVVQDAILEWTSTYGRISFVDALMLRCDSATLAKELKDSKKLSKFLIEQISPTYFLIHRHDHAKLVELLQEEDYMPKPEIEHFSKKPS
ncbi:hypothetical protein GF339_11165 [candidate division KSB3 bacterium]|uniref:Helicase XPB/Ssl2 N-terminal domain-containing protein n=1 Tax=candidate division KSB3 bacterium TaxID=2044937 RepID=A0A9D5JWR1_9BACT|nr:hypothetical protein [candidate division KSB3 bacterium]MBD3325136.1 hypothetical protein [candidate division KSB3 bacterium]